METTYKVEAKCNMAKGINVEFKGFETIEGAIECADTLELAFPQVDIICEQTGEVAYSKYVSLDLFVPELEMDMAIADAEFDRCV